MCVVFDVLCVCCFITSETLLDHLFFFFKQKTAYEVRISDWSSDVCSSDLADGRGDDRRGDGEARARGRRHAPSVAAPGEYQYEPPDRAARAGPRGECRRKPDRARHLWQYVERGADHRLSPSSRGYGGGRHRADLLVPIGRAHV